MVQMIPADPPRVAQGLQAESDQSSCCSIQTLLAFLVWQHHSGEISKTELTDAVRTIRAAVASFATGGAIARAGSRADRRGLYGRPVPRKPRRSFGGRRCPRSLHHEHPADPVPR